MFEWKIALEMEYNKNQHSFRWHFESNLNVLFAGYTA